MKEVFIALLMFALVGGGVVFGFRYRAERKDATDLRPSIADFSPENLPANIVKEDAPNSNAAEGETKKEESTPAKLDAPAMIAVRILNGGAVGGSAGKMVAYLKQNGYTKAEAGNANGANVGIVVYYSVPMADEAKALQLLLLKEYKGVTSKPVEEAKIPEVKTTPIAVVLGA